MKDLSQSSVLLLAGILVSSAFAAVKPLSAPLELDGRLDEQAWKDAAWEGPFVRMETRTTQKVTAQTEFALLADAKNLYVGIRCFEPEMKKCFPKNRSANMVDVLFAPGGNTFDFYHFIFRYAEDRAVHTSFLSEGGNIQPDRYIPDLTVKSAEMEGGWSLEIAFPLSAFYMTRNRQWSETWLMNVCRQRVANDESGYSTEYSSWAPIFARFREPKRMKPMAGFPRRAPADDVAILDLNATVSACRADGLVGEATMKIVVAESGEYELSSPNLETTRLVLNAGENRAKAACRFADNGRHYAKLTLTRVKTGETYSRTYPFRIDFSEVRVRLTTPAYRDNFYPGQCADRVKGTVLSAVKGEVAVTLEGPGFPTRTATLPEGGGPIDFDTKGFRDGEATLTVVAEGKTSKTRILKLAPTGHDMAWVENGHIVLNGRQILPRRLYAHGYHGGEAFAEGRFKANLDRLCLTREVRTGGGLYKDEDEARQDRKPSKAALEYIEKQVAKNKDKDFTAYYIADEPECRNVSPIYLRHIYEYVKKIDPYHVVLMSTRGGAQFLECADWLETHPYINPHDDGKGNRVYSDPPARIGNYLDAFQAWDRPDKCIGFLPTLFSYRYQSYLNDYPTFDEYVMHTWAAMMHGGKSLNPYAYHDIGDRPGLFEGACYTFSSFAALEDIVLNGKRTWLVNSDTAKCVRYDLPDESMLVLVNPTLKPQTATVKGIGAKYREFRGTRTWSGDTTFDLKPCETIVATTKRHDEGLPTFAEAKAFADRLEAERLGRDNQLLEKHAEISFTLSGASISGHELVDGVRDVYACRKDWQDETNLDLAFREARSFRVVRVFGDWTFDPAVSVWQDGAWRELEPVTTEKVKYGITYGFGDVVRTDRVRISFRPPKGRKAGRNLVELYEVELGRLAGGSSARPLKPTVVFTTPGSPVARALSDGASLGLAPTVLGTDEASYAAALKDGGHHLFVFHIADPADAAVYADRVARLRQANPRAQAAFLLDVADPAPFKALCGRASVHNLDLRDEEIAHGDPVRHVRAYVKYIAKGEGGVDYARLRDDPERKRREARTQRLHDAKWGVFNHYLGNAKMTAEEWNRRVDSFDVKRLADQLEACGAKFYFITLMQGWRWMCAPNATFDRIGGIGPGEACARRDLPMELADELRKRGIDLYLYYTGDGPYKDRELGKRFGFTQARYFGVNETFVRNWAAVLEEYAVRYGDKVKGWWIDGCYGEKSFCYTDDLLDPYAAAVRKGSPTAVFAMNDGVKPYYTKHYRDEDFTCGEFDSFYCVPKSRFIDGAQAFALIPLGRDKDDPEAAAWGATGCKQAPEFVANYVKMVNDRGGVIAIDVHVEPDGAWDPEQFEALKLVGRTTGTLTAVR